MAKGWESESADEPTVARGAPSGDDSVAKTVARPSARTPPQTPETPETPETPSSSSTVTSTAAAMEQDELRRTNLLGRLAVILCISVGIGLPFIGGNQDTKWMLWIAISVAAVCNAVLIYLTSKPHRFRKRAFSALFFVSGVSVVLAVIYFGIYSAAVIICGLGVYVSATGQSRWLAFSVYFAMAGIIGAVSIAIITGAIDDPGLVRADGLSRSTLAVLSVLLQLCIVVVFLLGRFSREATRRSIRELEVAMLAVSQREAMLEEAREEIERAHGLGATGRLSGQTLGSFRLGPVIGRGAMGEIYEASHVDTGDAAAVKLLQAHMTPNTAKRFRREVEIARRLNNPHIVEVLEVSSPDADIPFLAMELLRGKDLAAVLRERGVLADDELCAMLRQIGRGLSAAFDAGIVHRDIKPNNLFAVGKQPNQTWKILDFGVSKLATSSGTLTEGQVIGTPTYMAPEQAQGLDTDYRADLYALGAIAYRCLTGRKPFPGGDPASVLYNVVYTTPVRPSWVAPELSRDVDEALMVALAKAPIDRYDSADEFASAIEAALEGALPNDVRARAQRLSREHPWREY